MLGNGDGVADTVEGDWRQNWFKSANDIGDLAAREWRRY